MKSVKEQKFKIFNFIYKDFYENYSVISKRSQ